MQVKKRSAGIVVTRHIKGETYYLLLRCYRYWDFPKGEIEPGEEPLQAACRESEEETGLTGFLFPRGEVYTETPVYGNGKVARYYLGESPAGDVALPVSPELGAPEHHEFRWMSYAEAQSLVNDRIRVVLDWAQEQVSN
jgi:8-oxo-dGTP pyrophosphatase MutT (NUDIX family)